jgi:hypothetical protein
VLCQLFNVYELSDASPSNMTSSDSLGILGVASDDDTRNEWNENTEHKKTYASR